MLQISQKVTLGSIEQLSKTIKICKPSSLKNINIFLHVSQIHYLVSNSLAEKRIDLYSMRDPFNYLKSLISCLFSKIYILLILFLSPSVFIGLSF